MKRLTSIRVPITDIDPGDRTRQEYPRLDELALSIQESGLINSLTLADKSKIQDWKGIDKDKLNPDKPYLLLAGGRRYFAIRKNDIMQEVDARIYDKVLTPEEIKTIELEENLKRVDLTWTEEVTLKERIHDIQQRIHGKAVRGSRDGKGHSIKDTAKMLDEDESTTIKDIKLAKALKNMPTLATAKTKTDAQKMLRKLKRDMDTESKAKKIESTRANTPVEKQRKQLRDAYILKPFEEGIAAIKDKTIDIVEIDPPYAIDLVKEKKAHQTIIDDYDDIEDEVYEEFMRPVLSECYRVMKPHSWLIMWFGPDPWFDSMLGWIRDAGFTCRGLPGIWSKGRGQTQQPTRYLANSYEMFFYAQKGSPAIKKQGRANVFDYPPSITQNKIHPTERPIEMIQDVLETFGDPGQHLLVPFLGSGNTLLAASNIGMHGFGYDKVDTFRDYYVDRVEGARPGDYKSYTGT